MRGTLSVLASLALLLVFGAGPAAAQDYSGTDPTKGVFDVPAKIEPGGVFKFEASDLKPGAEVNATIVSGSDEQSLSVEPAAAVAVLGTQTITLSPVAGSPSQADTEGKISTSFALPKTIDPGAFEIRVASTKADGSAFLAVSSITIAKATNSLGSPSDQLAFTGASSLTLQWAGSLLLLLGVGTVAAIRFRPARRVVSVD